MTKIKKQNNWCVYLHIVPRNISVYNYRKYYVGITSRPPEERWGKNGENYKRQIFYNAIQKYGWDNIKHKILYKKLTEDEAKEKEMQLIKEYRSLLGDRGYNATMGGEGSHIRECPKSSVIYCIELGMAFKSAGVAEKITGESQGGIRNKAKKYSEGNKEIRKGYHYCYIQYIGKVLNNNIQVGCNPVVYLKNKKIYPHAQRAIDELNLCTSRRSVLTKEKYLKHRNSNILNLKLEDKLMFLYDYLQIFDYI